MTADRASAQGAEETADEREPKPCPRCGVTCVYDGWDHVHPYGIGIGSCKPAQPVDAPAVGNVPMSESSGHVAAVGDGDRLAAARMVDHWNEEPLASFSDMRRDIAAALADERRRVIEPFEKLAAEWETRAASLRGRTYWYYARHIRDALAEVAGRAGSGEAGK